MGNFKYIVLLIMVMLFSMLPASSQDQEYSWGIGVSALSPGLPAALKVVYSPAAWGVQLEANYFYLWGMARIDGRREVFSKGISSGYIFAGITANHFNDPDEGIENVLSADLGIGAELRLGKKQRFSIGAEGGLLVPFYSSKGLENYQDSGFMVANIYALIWF